MTKRLVLCSIAFLCAVTFGYSKPIFIPHVTGDSTSITLSWLIDSASVGKITQIYVFQDYDTGGFSKAPYVFKPHSSIEVGYKIKAQKRADNSMEYSFQDGAPSLPGLHKYRICVYFENHMYYSDLSFPVASKPQKVNNDALSTSGEVNTIVVTPNTNGVFPEYAFADVYDLSGRMVLEKEKVPYPHYESEIHQNVKLLLRSKFLPKGIYVGKLHAPSGTQYEVNEQYNQSQFEVVLD